MREAHLRYLLAAALIVVAGYGAYTAAPQADESPASATTPIEASETTPVPTTEEPPERLAPGLTDEGVIDSVTLAEAHTNQLRNTSYTVVIAQTTWNGNRSFYWRVDFHARVDVEGSSVHLVRNTSGVPPSPTRLQSDVAIWRNDTHSFSRLVDPNGTASYRRSSPERDLIRGTPGRGAFVRSLFSEVNTTVAERVERNGTTRYRVVSTSQPDSALVADRPRSNLSLSALVDSSGLVHRYQVSYDIRVDGETHHATRTWRLSDVGSTTVEKPPWFDDAMNETVDRGRKLGTYRKIFTPSGGEN